MLETNIRQIAIQAIAARASGSPVEAAGQILAGIAALDSPGKPFVIWPKYLPMTEQIEVLELELERLRASVQAYADDNAKRLSELQLSLDARSKHPSVQSHPEAGRTPAEEAAGQEDRDEAKAEAHPLLLSQTPVRGASDASL